VRAVFKNDEFAYIAGMNEESPILSDFETPEQAAAYDKWFREKVKASLADPRPSIPHEEVMAEMREIIEGKGKRAQGC